MPYRFKARSAVPGEYAFLHAALNEAADYPAENQVKTAVKYANENYTGDYGGGGYTYGDDDASEVLTTAIGAGTYQPVAVEYVKSGTPVGVAPAVGTYGFTVPAQPVIVATVVGTTVTVDIDGGAGATNYLFYRSKNDAAWQTAAPVVGDGQVEFEDMVPGNIYYFVCYSRKEGIYSIPSNLAVITIPSDPSVITNILESGLQWMHDKQYDTISNAATYIHSESELNLNVIIAKKSRQVTRDEAGNIIDIFLDFLIRRGDLIIGENCFDPQQGDEVIMLYEGMRDTYEVVEVAAKTAYNFSDPYHQYLRVHTKLIARE